MAPLVAAAIIGAGASLASSASSLYGASQERAAAQQAKNNANRQISAWEQRANQILQESEAKATKLSGSGDVAKYRQMRDSYDPSKYVVDAQPFDKSGYSVEDYLNPNREAIKANISKQVASTAAGAGLGHSSGALEAYIASALSITACTRTTSTSSRKGWIRCSRGICRRCRISATTFSSTNNRWTP